MARKLTNFEECLNGVLGIVGVVLIVGCFAYAFLTDHQTSIDRMTNDDVANAQAEHALKEFRNGR